MFLHLGDKFARAEDFDGAFRLFKLALPPQDQAFAEFVTANFDAFSKVERDKAVEFIVTPDRGPKGFAIDVAYNLFSRMPENRSLRNLWWFWVNDYKFGGRSDVEETQQATYFFALMNSSAKQGLVQFEPIMELFKSRFRALARGGNTDGLDGAMALLLDADDARYVKRRDLAREVIAAFSSAECADRENYKLLRGPVTRLADAIANDRNQHDLRKPFFEAMRLALD